MAEYKYRRGLEEVRELCSLRQTDALGRKMFHDRECLRLPNGKKRDDHVIDGHVADRLAGAYHEIIQRIDVHLPKAQVKLPIEGNSQPAG